MLSPEIERLKFREAYARRRGLTTALGDTRAQR
jgi:hypothetical protein